MLAATTMAAERFSQSISQGKSTSSIGFKAVRTVRILKPASSPLTARYTARPTLGH